MRIKKIKDVIVVDILNQDYVRLFHVQDKKILIIIQKLILSF
jgi:hypothetical protein